MSYESLNGRTAVVTGAASGIGEAIALQLAGEGARVALLARRGERLEAIAGKIRADGGEALAVVTDVTDDRSVADAKDRVQGAYGDVDLVANSAGVMVPSPIDQGDVAAWTRMIDTNVSGVLRVTGAFTGDLIGVAAEGRTADLVNISSIGAHLTFPNYSVYSATKAALTHLSQCLRTEVGPRDVRVTNVEPGFTDSELRDHVTDPVRAGELDAMVAAVGSLTSEEVADLVTYAVSRPRHVNLRQVMVLPTRQA
ncbi:SDR family oxidoreductase [Streptomyces sp. DG2A-72]|uniref:SDR family oxidoreductase n=1 Tax=Streptomyces sp. DG2A-72 TaxID=3051386 RepID=UPI00265C23B0|nr:SDR family oxidoreductase [Streptomyces sp. DG2A-72]MDO0933735.1 SDR family oxidoreductase [Streptomyces sp. DG2A-72]